MGAPSPNPSPAAVGEGSSAGKVGVTRDGAGRGRRRWVVGAGGALRDAASLLDGDDECGLYINLVDGSRFPGA